MPKPSRQIAALPYRLSPHSGVEILLVTTRETRRWTLPKGWPMKGLKDHRAAAIEAFEEAGVRGKPSKRAIGAYDYVKIILDKSLPCEVTVYPLAVELEVIDWKERGQRERTWVSPAIASTLVREPLLRVLLERVEGLLLAS